MGMYCVYVCLLGDIEVGDFGGEEFLLVCGLQFGDLGYVGCVREELQVFGLLLQLYVLGFYEVFKLWCEDGICFVDVFDVQGSDVEFFEQFG